MHLENYLCKQNKEKKSHSGLHQDFNLYKGRIYIEKKQE